MRRETREALLSELSAQTKRGERYIRRRFILEQLLAFPEAERPATDREREDLERFVIQEESEQAVAFPRLPLSGPSEETLRQWNEIHQRQWVAYCARFDREISVRQTGPLAREVARIWERITPRLDAAGWVGESGQRNYAALLKAPSYLVEPPGSDEGSYYRAALAFVWRFAWANWCRENATKIATRVVLRKRAEDGEHETAEADVAAELLGSWLEKMIEKAKKAVFVSHTPSGIIGDLYAPHAELAAFIEAQADDAEDPRAVKDYAKDCRERWQASLKQLETDGRPEAVHKWEEVLYLPKVLGDFLWVVKVAPAIRRHLAGQKAALPAIGQEIHRQLVEMCWAPGRQLELIEDGKARLVDAAGNELAEVPLLDPDNFEAIQHGAALLRSLTGQRFFRYVVTEAHRQAGKPNAADIFFEGGFRGVATAIGENSKKAPDRIADVLKAGWSFQRQWAGGEVCGLWTYSHQAKAAQGQRAVLVVTPAPFLRPYYAIKRLGTERRFSVPILPEPEFVGRERDYAAQGVLLQLVGAELLEHREELVTEGGAKLAPAELDRLAQRAALPRKVLPEVLERWIAPGGPLEQVGADRYNLSDAERYLPARKWLIEAGRRTIAGRERRREGKKRRRS